MHGDVAFFWTPVARMPPSRTLPFSDGRSRSRGCAAIRGVTAPLHAHARRCAPMQLISPMLFVLESRAFGAGLADAP